MTKPAKDLSHLIWTQPEWIAGARAWIEAALRQHGLALAGAVEQPHIRPWATVMRVPAGGGLYYFKAAAPMMAFEPALTLALAQTNPECTPEVIAADLEKGWMLTRDAGAPLRGGLIKGPGDLGLLDRVLPMLADLQMAWAGRGDELAALGVPDARLHLLPARYERMVADRDALLLDGEKWLTAGQVDQLADLAPRYAEMCARLAASGIPESIHYDDMHTGNVLLREREGQPPKVTFSDWGDSSVGHPFASMLIFIRAMSDLLELPEDSTETPEAMPPVLAGLRDRYLEPWGRAYPGVALLETFNLAWRVGMAARAAAWYQYNLALDERDRADFAYYPPAWLSEFLLAMKGY